MDDAGGGSQETRDRERDGTDGERMIEGVAQIFPLSVGINTNF